MLSTISAYAIVLPAVVSVINTWLKCRLALKIVRQSGAKDAAVVLRALRRKPVERGPKLDGAHRELD